MIARVSNACTPKFSLVDWNNDRMTIKHAKTKMDQEGKNAFPMALMANRYEWYICPITALAVYMSSRSFTRGSDQLFSGSSETISKRYSDSMRAFLTRPDIKDELGEFVNLLKTLLLM